jgi:hypothetical protein
MAAILQFRQGTKTSFITSGPYISEPFFDTDTNIIHIGVSGSSSITLTKLEDINSGSFSVSGDISGSNLYLSGDLTASNATLGGDITIGGNIILGDSVTDDITISGQLDSNLIPKTDNTHDLGSTTKKWANLHVVSGSIDSIDLISNLPSGVISGSSQLPSGIVSGSEQLPSGIISGSEQLPSSIVSSSQQVVNFLPDGTISGSEQLPSGIISGSEQLPSGVVSGSNQIDTGSTHFQEGIELYSINGVTPLSGLYGSANGLGVQIRGLSADGLAFDGPGNLIIDTGSDYFISGAQEASLLGLPEGTVSSSQQVIDFLPTDTVSGSSQISELTHIHSFTSSYNTAISLNGDDVTIIGDLTVQGTQTQLNTATLNIEDKNLLIASGAVDSSAANGAGITIDGANKSLEWEHGTSQFVFDAQVSSSIGFKGDGSNLTDVTAEEIEYTNILNKPTLVSGSDQVLGGTNIVSSSTQVINFLPSGTVSGSEQVLGGTSIVSSSNQVITYLPSGTVSGSTQIIEVLETQTPGLVSGSDQVTQSLDLRYLEINGDNVLSSSIQNFTDYSESVDLRLENTLQSGSATSQSLHNLVGNFPTSGSLGTAAFYNVSSSLADDPNVIPNVKAVYDYINNTIGAADITGVSASLGLSGGGASGYVSLSLDTTSQHFINGVQSAQSYYGGWYADATNGTQQHISSGEKLYFRGDTTTNDISTTITQLLGINYIELQINTGSSHFSNAVAAIGAPAGTVSGSEQVTDLLPSGVISGSDQLPSGIISGSAISTDGTDLVAIGTSVGNVADLGSGNQLSLYGTSISGLTSFDISGTAKSFDYVASDYRYIDTNTGVGIVIKPDADGTKAWVIDTDGDLVSNGGAWNGTGKVFADGAVIRNNITASYILADEDVTANNFIGNILATNGVVSGSNQIINSLPTGTLSGSDQISASLDTRYVNLTGAETIEGNKTFDNNVIVEGNLTVNGTTTSVNSNTVNIGDNIIVLNSDETGTPSQDGGIDIKRGTQTSARIMWDESEDYWSAGLVGAESKILTDSNVDYYTNADNTTHLNSLEVLSGSISTAQVTEISNLDANEGAQLENIDSVTISNTQWGYLGSSDQGIASGDDVKFGTVRVDDPTASTSKTTGALIVDGGAGIFGALNVGGDIVAYASSDRRLKDEIIPISNPLEKINQIGGYSFVWNTQKQDIYKGKDYGVLAQEIEEILPELVDTRENGYKAVKYDKLVSLLIEGIKELSSEVKELKEKLNRE